MKLKAMAFPLFLLICFILGSAFSSVIESNSASSAQQIALAVFIFVVSYDVGGRLRSSNISKMMKQILVLSASCVVGSALAGGIFSFFSGFDIRTSLAISLGMGWYTFDGPALATYYGSLAGAFGFFSNFLRELFTLIAYTPLSLIFGKAKPIPMGGATTMDTTLTVMRSEHDPHQTALAFTHGAVISFLVPIIVTSLL